MFLEGYIGAPPTVTVASCANTWCVPSGIAVAESKPAARAICSDRLIKRGMWFSQSGHPECPECCSLRRPPRESCGPGNDSGFREGHPRPFEIMLASLVASLGCAPGASTHHPVLPMFGRSGELDAVLLVAESAQPARAVDAGGGGPALRARAGEPPAGRAEGPGFSQGEP